MYGTSPVERRLVRGGWGRIILFSVRVSGRWPSRFDAPEAAGGEGGLFVFAGFGRHFDSIPDRTLRLWALLGAGFARDGEHGRGRPWYEHRRMPVPRKTRVRCLCHIRPGAQVRGLTNGVGGIWFWMGGDGGV